MKKFTILAVLIVSVFMVFYGCGKRNPAAPVTTPVPTMTNTPDWTHTITPTHTVSPTATHTRTITETGTITATHTVSPTATHTRTVTQTHTITRTHTVSPTSTATGTPIVLQQGSLGYFGNTDVAVMTAPYADSNGGNCPDLIAGNVFGVFAGRSLIKFDLTAYSAVTISKAELVLSPMLYSSPNNVTAYELTGAWAEGTTCTSDTTYPGATWNKSYPGYWTNPGGDYNPSAVSDSHVVDSSADVVFTLNTAMVQGWINNSTANMGIILRSDDESALAGVAQFRSKDNPLAANRPRLILYQ